MVPIGRDWGVEERKRIRVFWLHKAGGGTAEGRGSQETGFALCKSTGYKKITLYKAEHPR